jgi:hypothetical protein
MRRWLVIWAGADTRCEPDSFPVSHLEAKVIMTAQTRITSAIAGLVVLSLLVGTRLMAAQADQPLTNDDIVKMVNGSVSEAIITRTIQTVPTVKFDLSPAGLVALKAAAVPDRLVEIMQSRASATGSAPGRPQGLERASTLAASNDDKFVLRNFKTLFVDASRATVFGGDQVKAAMGANRDFRQLNIVVVDDRAVADVVLEVSYTFAWDFPFVLKSPDTSAVLVSGIGVGPFSGPLGAANVVEELTRLLKPYRAATPRKP